MSVPMASTKNYMNELFGTVLVLTALLSPASAVDCHGKSFHCVNSTHFMICVDLGGGVSQAIDDFYIACPPPNVCLGTNHFECEYPAPTTPATIRSTVISETTLPWENIITSSSLDNTTKEFSENYVNTERTTTVEYSVTTDTTVDVTMDTTVNVTTTGVTDFNINNDLNATKIVPTTTADIMTTPLESVSNDRNITEITITTEDVTTSVIETVTESTVEVSNRTNTYLGGVSKESNTNISDILVDKHSTGGYHGFPKAPLPHNQYNVSSTDISKPYPTELHTQTNGQSDPIKLGVNGSNFYNKTKQPTNEKGKNTPPQITEVNDTDNKTKSNFGITTSTQKPSISANTPVFPEVIVTASGPLTGGNDANQTKDTMGAENAIDAINLDRAITTESTGNAPSLEQTTVTYEGNFDKNYNQNTEPVNLDIKTTDTILDSNVELVTPHAPPLIQSSAGTPTVDAFTIETIQKVSTSENPTTIYEENLNKNYTQNTETVNLDIITTETILDNNVEILTTQAPLVIQGSEDAMTVDAFTIGTVQKVSSSEHPTTIYEENLNKNYTPNTETVNLDITTTETILDNNVELVTTEGPSAIQSWTDSTTVDAFTIETVEKVSIEHPTTNEYTQNLATLNLDSVTTEAMALSNSDVQFVTTQAPILTHSSANNTTLPGAFTTETIGNAPSQNIESVNVDIITTDAIDTPFNSDVQLVTTDAPPVTQNSVEKTTEDGAFTNELAEKLPSYEKSIAENEENLTKDSTQISINVDIVTTEAVHTTFLNSDVQPGVTQALPATLSIAEITILDGANNIETVTKAPSFEQPTTISDVNSIKESSPNITAESVYLDTTQTIDTVNLAIVTTKPVDGLSVSNVQLVTIQVPPLTQSSADTKFGGALPIETDENIVSTELPTTIYEQSWTVAENKGNVKEKSIIIPASKSKNEDIMTTETIFESTTIIKDQSILTNTETIKNDIITEQPITTNEENASTDNKVITTGHSVIFDKTVDDVSSSSNSNYHKNQGASTKVQLVTDTLVEETKVDIVFTTGTVGNDDGTTEASLITDTTQNTDSNILSISQDHTATETENVKTITSQSTIENSINNVSSLPAPENTVSVPELNNDIDFETAKQINVGKIIAKEPELVSKTELAIEVTTNNNYAQVELDNGSPKQKSKSESDDISKQILSEMNLKLLRQNQSWLKNLI
ncbi:probable GPI-anchored adhesin-like protein PGA55 [Leguminivora glycinivorella]|uniref:probable GPI-anchored adhesin-like protein PGA55 n=1 Tax=Leguminivora glycinivorella TaxID=1035111 RepID=UPI00200C49B8|nr:probable GPI-anchored adhesin-like protein PGA55 [Leguminivora glycinivorella]